MRKINSRPRPEFRLVVYSTSVLACVLTGPFGTGTDLTFWDRVVFWTVAISSVGFFMEYCIGTLLMSNSLKSWPVSLRVVLGCGLGAVPGASAIIFINRIFRPEHLDTNALPYFWASVAAMGLLISTISIAIDNRSIEPSIPKSTGPKKESKQPSKSTADQVTRKIDNPTGATSTPAIKPARLMDKLPERLRFAQIISLSMQDHYVEITTTRGVDVVLMRLVDAIELLDGVEGTRCHRSHWISQQHLVALSRDGRRFVAQLSDGRHIPVSTSYRDQVEELLTKKEQA